MSIVQNNSNIGLTNLAAEIKNAANSPNTKEVTPQVKQEKSADKESDVNTSAVQKTADITEGTPLNAKQLEKVAQQLQDFVGDLNRNLEFSVDKDSGRDVIKVFDKDSGDLLKQFPSEEVLTLVSKLSEMVGGFVDAKV
jgi:flagellar protein FlaG